MESQEEKIKGLNDVQKYIKQISSEEVQRFLVNNESSDENALVLKHREMFSVPSKWIAWQINGRRRALEKFPFLYNAVGVVFPPQLNLEQSTGEATAIIKTSLLANDPAIGKDIVVDLTAGFGIDSLFFTRVFSRVVSTEQDPLLVSVLKHNASVLKYPLEVHNMSAADFISSMRLVGSLYYADPSRRVSGDRKVFRLSECEPDVTKLQPQIFALADFFLVKCSPLLDIRQGLRELQSVSRVLVLAVNNECKEVLFLCRRGFMEEPSIEAIHLGSRGKEEFCFRFSDEESAITEYSPPLEYLFEPNAAILKAGAFKAIVAGTILKKLHPDTHLYTSDEVVQGFPGRVFRIDGELKSNARDLAAAFPDGRANVIARNYPAHVDEIKKKLKLRDGGEAFLLATTSIEKRHLLRATRVA